MRVGVSWWDEGGIGKGEEGEREGEREMEGGNGWDEG